MNVLIIYYSTNGSTKKMSRLIARGVEKADGVDALLRTVNSTHNNEEEDDPIVTSDLINETNSTRSKFVVCNMSLICSRRVSIC